MIKRKILGLVALASFALGALLAGCGSDDGSGTNSVVEESSSSALTPAYVDPVTGTAYYYDASGNLYYFDADGEVVYVTVSVESSSSSVVADPDSSASMDSTSSSTDVLSSSSAGVTYFTDEYGIYYYDANGLKVYLTYVVPSSSSEVVVLSSSSAETVLSSSSVDVLSSSSYNWWESSSSTIITSSSSEVVSGSCTTADSYIAFSTSGVTVGATNGGVSVNGSVVTISCGGNYYLSGTAADGQVIVETPSTDTSNVYLYLNGVTLTNSSDAPIYVKNAEKTFLVMVAGTTNTFTDGSTRSYGTDTASACIFSKDDLTLKGTGTLKVYGKYNNGIHSSNDLRVRETPVINVEAVNNGIKGKESVDIEGGTFTVTTTNGDAIKADSTGESGKDYVNITGGTFTLKAGRDGIQAYNYVNIAAGTFDITTGTGVPNTSASSSGGMGGGGWNPGGTTTTDTDTTSYKGIKSDKLVYICGGTFTLNTVEDALHSNSVVRIDGGTFTISGRRGAAAQDTLQINGGTILVKTSYEGFEATIIELNGGYTSITATDDGWNASSGDEGVGHLYVNGGTHIVYAGGDGLDSNGNFYVNDGLVIVEQNNSSGNGILDIGDRGYTFTFKGGTLLGIGTSAMTISVTGTYLGFTTLNASAGQMVSVANSSGSVIATMKAVTTASAGIFMSSNYNTNYKFYVGGTFSGTLTSDPGATGISYATTGTITGATAK